MKRTITPLPSLVCPVGLKSLPRELCKGFRLALYEPIKPPHTVAAWISQPFANTARSRRALESCWRRFCEAFDVNDIGDFYWGLFPYDPSNVAKYGGYAVDESDDVQDTIEWLESVKDKWADVTGSVTA